MSEGPAGSSTEVTIEDLRRVLDRCLDDCERRLGHSIELDADYYWLVEATEAFDLSRVPVVVAGQLSDDLAELRDAPNYDVDGQPVASWHELTHALGVLQRLAAMLQLPASGP